MWDLENFSVRQENAIVRLFHLIKGVFYELYPFLQGEKG